jgi:hypothetical protein
LFDVFGQCGRNQIDPAPAGLTVIVRVQVVVRPIQFRRVLCESPPKAFTAENAEFAEVFETLLLLLLLLLWALCDLRG